MLAVFGVRSHAEGQTEARDQPSEQSADAASHPTQDASSLSELRAKRDKAQAELDAVNRPNTLSTGAPPGTPEPELIERRTLLHHIVRSADEQIDDTLRLEQARQHRNEVGRSIADSKDQGETPPYTVFDADRLWDTAFALRLAVEGLQSQLALIEQRSTRARDSLRAAEERLRQASEHMESTRSPSEADRNRWLRDLEALRQRAAAAMLQATELSKVRIGDELADARARLQTAVSRLSAVDPLVEFREADLEQIRTRLSQERQRLAQ
ncbi:MAG TPA: hypothetical protein VFQ06_04650, partial [Nitrospira sp.]|nr:hypothetical protein [Nitrospira sp.]